MIAAIERRLESSIVDQTPQPGGFSPAVASRVRLADGRRAFLKIVGPEPNPDSAEIYRTEARNAAALPSSAPAPRLLWSLDDGEWVVIAFEDVNGRHPLIPWRAAELDRVLAAMADLAASLTPPPFDAPAIAAALGDQFVGWRRFAARPQAADGIDPWAWDRLGPLAELEERWTGASTGTTLLHTDVRADNILLTEDRVLFVDWPHATVGAAWIDLMGMLPSVVMQGGPDPEPVFAAHPVAEGADPTDVDAVLAGLAGYFLWHGTLPAPPGLPTLRAFQSAQGERALSWLRQRLEREGGDP